MDKLNAKVFEIRANLFDPVDVRGGLKVVEQLDGTYRTRYGVPEDYPDSKYQGTVLLFIDDLTHAPKLHKCAAAAVAVPPNRYIRASHPTQLSLQQVTAALIVPVQST